MRYAFTNTVGTVKQQGEITTLLELAAVLLEADTGLWVEGLGFPGSIGGCRDWKRIGEFIRDKVIPLQQ